MDAQPGISVRPGDQEDAPALAQVLVEALSSYREWAPAGWNPHTELPAREIGERLAADESWCLVAEAGGEPVAYVVLLPALDHGEPREPVPGLAHLWHLFVVPRWWGSGVARLLHDEAIAEAARRGYTEARLWTPKDNARARAFYRREGWRESGAETFADDLDLELVEYRHSL